MIKGIIDAVVFSNFFIALGAVCMYATSLYIAGQPAIPYNDPALYLVFFSTLCFYNLLRWVGLQKADIDAQTSLLRWVQQHRRTILTLTVASAFATLYFFMKVTPVIRYTFIIASIVSIVYAFPLIPARDANRTLREIGLLKTVIVALSWTLVTALIPCLSITSVHFSTIAMICFSTFLFILGITIPFDLRDMRQDQKAGLTTIAGKLGLKKTRQLAIFILVFGITFMVIRAFVLLSASGALSPTSVNAISYISNHTLMGIISIMVAIRLISRLDFSSNEYHYTLLLDGTIVLQYLLILLGYHLLLWVI